MRYREFHQVDLLARFVSVEVDGKLAALRFDVLCNGVCDAFLLLFFERMRPKEHQSADWMARQQRKIDGGVAEIARLIGDREYAVGNGFTLGDIAAGTVYRYFPGKPELLAALIDSISAREVAAVLETIRGRADVQVKSPPGAPGACA